MTIKWLAFQPLIGGMDLGAEKAFGVHQQQFLIMMV